MTSVNRGPAAASGNRAALLASARRLFAEQGYAVPLTVIAKDAGVGQGSLYRHFPTREDLAAAIVEESMTTLAELAETPGPQAFALLWREVVDDLVESVGFLDAALGPRGEIDGAAPGEQLAGLVAEPLERAREAGAVAQDLTVADVMLVLSMLHGAVHREPDPRTRRETAYRALSLVGRGLALAPPPPTT